PGDQSESARGIDRRNEAKAKEDNYQPRDQRDQQRLRNRGNRLRLQQRPTLAKLHHEGCRLRLKGALRVIVRRETMNGHVKSVTHLLDGVDPNRVASLRLTPPT